MAGDDAENSSAAAGLLPRPRGRAVVPHRRRPGASGRARLGRAAPSSRPARLPFACARTLPPRSGGERLRWLLNVLPTTTDPHQLPGGAMAPASYGRGPVVREAPAMSSSVAARPQREAEHLLSPIRPLGPGRRLPRRVTVRERDAWPRDRDVSGMKKRPAGARASGGARGREPAGVQPEGRRGISKRNVLPPPGALATATTPPWRRTMCLTMARPNPVPPCSRERALSTR